MNKKTIIWIMVCLILVVSVFAQAQNSTQIDIEEVKTLKTVEMQKDKIKEKKEFKINSKGKIDLMLEVNSSYCGVEKYKEKYYMLQKKNGEQIKFKNKIMVDNSCKYNLYYEPIQFDLLEKNFTQGEYILYRWTNNMYLFVDRINITGQLPSTIDNQKKEKDILDKIYDILKAFFDELKRIGSSEEPEDYTLDVKTVDWVKVGQNWQITAIFKRNGQNVNNGECMLNTNFWGNKLMNYDSVSKEYVTELKADKEGTIKWTVECGY